MLTNRGILLWYSVQTAKYLFKHSPNLVMADILIGYVVVLLQP